MAGVLVLLARPRPLTLIAGSAVALLGLFVRAWAAGHIHKFEKLAVTGPYSHTRNPLYFGSFLIAAGVVIAAGVWWLALIVGIMYLGIYYPVMRVEEGDLRSRFGSEFEEFAERVPLFFPRPTSGQAGEKPTAEFDFQLYLKHREYQGAIGVAIVIGALALRMYFFPL